MIRMGVSVRRNANSTSNFRNYNYRNSATANTETVDNHLTLLTSSKSKSLRDLLPPIRTLPGCAGAVS